MKQGTEQWQALLVGKLPQLVHGGSEGFFFCHLYWRPTASNEVSGSLNADIPRSTAYSETKLEGGWRM